MTEQLLNPTTGDLDLLGSPSVGGPIGGGLTNTHCVLYIDENGNVACDPDFTFTDRDGLFVETSSSTDGDMYAIWGKANYTGVGDYIQAGVYGETGTGGLNAGASYGVWGEDNKTGGGGYGVYGNSTAGGTGVYGTGQVGVYGQADVGGAMASIGIYGTASGATQIAGRFVQDNASGYVLDTSGGIVRFGDSSGTGTLSISVNANGVATFNAGGTGGSPNPSIVFSDDVSVPDETYGSGWNGSLEVPTKNAIYDKIETLPGLGLILAIAQANVNF